MGGEDATTEARGGVSLGAPLLCRGMRLSGAVAPGMYPGISYAYMVNTAATTAAAAGGGGVRERYAHNTPLEGGDFIHPKVPPARN